jgi:hypothetical protein
VAYVTQAASIEDTVYRVSQRISRITEGYTRIHNEHTGNTEHDWRGYCREEG